MDDLFNRLKKRLPHHSDSEIVSIKGIIEYYDISLTLKNLDDNGLVLFDQQNKTVRICFADRQDNLIQFKFPDSDIAIVFTDGICSGWINIDKTNVNDIHCFTYFDALHKLPETFSFIQECEHLEVHGGYCVGDRWECLGCGERIIFSLAS